MLLGNAVNWLGVEGGERGRGRRGFCVWSCSQSTTDQCLLCYLVLGELGGLPRRVRHDPSQGGRGARSPRTSVMEYYRSWGENPSVEILRTVANSNWGRGSQTNVLTKIRLSWVLLNECEVSRDGECMPGGLFAAGMGKGVELGAGQPCRPGRQIACRPHSAAASRGFSSKQLLRRGSGGRRCIWEVIPAQ